MNGHRLESLIRQGGRRRRRRRILKSSERMNYDIGPVQHRE
jgi:hypothetical protein